MLPDVSATETLDDDSKTEVKEEQSEMNTEIDTLSTQSFVFWPRKKKRKEEF